MATLLKKKEPHATCLNLDKVAAKIRQRRRQILVHSYLYYDLDESIVSDDTWSRWAKELAALQVRFPNVAKKVEFNETFREFDGSTGFDLNYRDESIINAAHRTLNYHKSLGR